MAFVEDFSKVEFNTGSVTAKETAKKPTKEQLDSWTAAYAVADAASIGAPAAPAQATADAALRSLDDRVVVGRGSAGADILDMQSKLDALGFDLGTADGIYGPKTEAAVRKFQESQGITVDGIIGPETRQKLDALQNPNEAIDAGALYAPDAPPPNPYAAADFGSFTTVHTIRPDSSGNPLLGGSSDYQNVLAGQGTNLDLNDVEGKNDGEDHVVVQSIYDPVVSHKPTIVDEFSTVVTLPPGMTPQDLLRQLAGDVDGTIPHIGEHGDFRNQTDEPGVGTISEIDVNGGLIPVGWLGWLPGTIDQSPINAPVVMSEYDPDSHFVFQTIEQNGNEHPLHGAREFGFEELDNGQVRIYTRAVAAPDIGGNDIVGARPERDMWTAFVDGVDTYVTDNGGQVHSRNIVQDTNGPTGDEFWGQLSRNEQIAIRDSQVDGLQREVDRLQLEFDNRHVPDEEYDRMFTNLTEVRIDELQREIDAWNAKEIDGQ